MFSEEFLPYSFPTFKFRLQIIEDSSNYQFGFNHSTGYSMIGYLCAYMRYYYPEEFIAAYLNNANNEDDIRYGTELARVKNITIHPIKFRHSGAEYTVDKETHSLYKGCSSVKFLSADMAEQLYSMKDQRFSAFTDLLSVFPGNSKQLSILIRLNYFSEFGGSLRLLKIAELYDKYNGKKVLKKEKLDLPIEIVERYAKSSTEKQYRFEEEGMTAMLSELCSLVPDEHSEIISNYKLAVYDIVYGKGNVFGISRGSVSGKRNLARPLGSHGMRGRGSSAYFVKFNE